MNLICRVVIVLMLLVGGGLAVAQTMRGDFSGIVRDASGAAVPDTQVTIINETSTARRVITTDDQGRYVAPGFFVGSYRLEAEKAGFQKVVSGSVLLRPATVTPVDFILQVAQAGESVTVTASPPVIQSEAPTVNFGLDSAAFGRYEMNTSNRLMLPFTALQWTAGYASGRDAFMVFRGAPTEYTGFSLEGLTGRGMRFRVPAMATKSGEIVSFSAPAEYDRAVTVNTTLNSGTNKLHGEIGAYLTNPVLNAVKTPFYQGARDPGVSVWRYNLTAGGPFYLPALYNGKNKTYWYYALQKDKTTRTVRAIVNSAPTQRMRAGDFSRYPQTVKDPLTGQPFPGNIIPPARISGVSKAVSDEYYARWRYSGDPDSIVSNALTDWIDQTPVNSSVVKVDHNFTNGDVLNGFITWSPRDYRQATPQSFNELSRWYTFNLAHTHLFSPKLVNQLRIGFTRNKDERGKSVEDGSYRPEYGADVVKRIGLQGVNPPSNWQGYPQFNVSGDVFTSEANAFDGFAETKTVFSYYTLNDNLNIYRGRHEIKAGLSLRKIRHDWAPAGNLAGSYSFSGTFSDQPYADFLLGYPSGFNRTESRVWIAGRRWEYGAFVQDTFRVNSKMTFTYGLRWSHYTVPTDKNGLFYNFDVRTFAVVVPDQQALSNVRPAWPVASAPVKLASELGYPENLLNSHSDWGPRLGFAYRPTGKWVVRGGGGLYTGLMAFAELQTGGPFQITESFTNLLVGGKPQYSFPNPFPASSKTIAVNSATAVDRDFRTGYTMNWNLTTERALPWAAGLRISYIGYKTSRIPFSFNMNTPALSTQPFSPARRPYPNFQSLTYITNGANANYHGVEVTLSRQMRNGLYMQTTYSWNRPETEIHGQRNPENQVAGGIDYAYDRARDKGFNADWTRHDFIVNYVYEVPLGAGRPFWGDLPSRGAGGKLLNGVIGNWAFSGYFNWHSGNFFTPTYSGKDPGGINQLSGRADVVPGCDPYAGGRNVGKGKRWFNSACFALPQPGTLGNAKINSLVGPGAWVFSINPYKEFPIRERLKMQVGAQIYNLFNHPNYNVPISIITSPTAGLINALGNMRRATQAGVMRSIQLTGSIRF